jgi:hypothetical protein
MAVLSEWMEFEQLCVLTQPIEENLLAFQELNWQ